MQLRRLLVSVTLGCSLGTGLATAGEEVSPASIGRSRVEMLGPIMSIRPFYLGSPIPRGARPVGGCDIAVRVNNQDVTVRFYLPIYPDARPDIHAPKWCDGEVPPGHWVYVEAELVMWRCQDDKCNENVLTVLGRRITELM